MTTDFEIPDPDIFASIDETTRALLEKQKPKMYKSGSRNNNLLGFARYVLGQAKEVGITKTRLQPDLMVAMPFFSGAIARALSVPNINPECNWTLLRRVGKYDSNTRGDHFHTQTKVVCASFAARVIFPEHIVYTNTSVVRMSHTAMSNNFTVNGFGYTIFPGAQDIVIDRMILEGPETPVNDALSKANIILKALAEETR
jgi:hypothetical protein